LLQICGAIMDDVMEGYAPDGRRLRVRFSRDGIEEITEPATVPDTVITPGLIDIQINGFGGVDINTTGDDEGLLELLRMLWDRGVTTLYPTIVSADRARTARLIERIADARRADPRLAYAIPGLHLEGPYLSGLEGARGAHDPDVLRDPDAAEFAAWQAAADGLIRIVTLAPERDGAIEFTRHLAGQGVIVSLGHSAARAANVHAFALAGGRLSTHLGNGIPALIDRHDNPLWAQLSLPLTATFIADGHHLPAEAFTAMVRAKGVSRSILVSDAAALAGCPPGDYQTAVGGAVTVGHDGLLGLTGTPYLAGSGASLDQCVRWAAATGALGLRDALTMATANPAALTGLTDRGTLRVGHRADLAQFERTPDGGIGRLLTTVTDGVVRVRDGDRV
jgi:N-acetylglucosamine-6-phosphate deacetylase